MSASSPQPWLFEIGLPGAPLRISKVPWDYRSTGLAFRPRVRSIRYPKYVVSTEDSGVIAAPEMSFEYSDVDGELAQRLEGIDKEDIKRSSVVAREGDLALAFSASVDKATMILVRVDWSEDRVATFVCRVDDDPIQHSCPKDNARITVDSFPHADPAAYDKPAPIPYGVHGSNSYNGQGFLTLICVDTVAGQYLVSIGRVQGVDNVYVGDARLDTAMYTVSYGAVRGTWYTFVTLRFDTAITDFSAIPDLAKNYGTAQGGDGTHMTLADNASSTDNDPEYIGATAYIYAGTGAGQSATIVSYSGSTKVIEVAAFSPSPDTTSKYVVLDLDGKTLKADVRGYTESADGSGDLIVNPIDQIAHAISNFMVGAWRRGAWLPTWSRLGALSLDRDDPDSLWSFFNDRGYVGAGVIDSNGTGANQIAAWLKTFGCVGYWWTDGKLYFDVSDVTRTAIYNSDPASNQEHLDLPDDDDRNVVGALTVRFVRDSSTGQYMSTLSVRDPDARTEAAAAIDQEWGSAL